MNRMRLGFAVLVMVISLAAIGFAAGNDQSGANCWKQGRHGHEPFFRLIHKLQLTDDQKHEVAGILQQHENDLKTNMKGMVDARKQLINAVTSETYNEAAVSQASQQVATYQEQLALIRAQIVGQIMGILTQEQKSTIQAMKTKMDARMGSFVDDRFAHMDKWIAKHSQ